MKPFTDIVSLLTFISQYEGPVDDFLLPISDSLDDPLGVHMTIVMEEIKEKGWQPDQYEEQNGYRIYKYKTMSNN